MRVIIILYMYYVQYMFLLVGCIIVACIFRCSSLPLVYTLLLHQLYATIINEESNDKHQLLLVTYTLRDNRNTYNTLIHTNTSIVTSLSIVCKATRRVI